MAETWFLMFDIVAMDGLGAASFAGRTTDPKVAEDWHQRCQEEFKSGYVVICTDTTYQVAHARTNWSDYQKQTGEKQCS